MTIQKRPSKKIMTNDNNHQIIMEFVSKHRIILDCDGTVGRSTARKTNLLIDELGEENVIKLAKLILSDPKRYGGRTERHDNKKDVVIIYDRHRDFYLKAVIRGSYLVVGLHRHG